jgi:stearoyl-CoA desaturase (delta-9 desaturase)
VTHARRGSNKGAGRSADGLSGPEFWGYAFVGYDFVTSIHGQQGVTVSTAATTGAEPHVDPKPKRSGEQTALLIFIVVPFLALLVAVPFAWGRALHWHDVLIAFVLYVFTGLGITVGYHRFFTHGSFRAGTPLTVVLAVAGSMAIEGPVLRWVADHRRHHAFSDRDGDPHSPWRYGESVPALMRGLFHAHLGWLFDPENTNPRRYAPDLLRNRAVMLVSRAFAPIVLFSLGLPALLGWLITGTWQGAATTFFWGSLVRVGLLHHVTWSINSICYAMGKRPFRSRDRSGNVWWLALLSFGESWHNLHHADPTCARHGVLPGQIDPSARTIRIFEQLGWATQVRWANPTRLAARKA